MTRSIFIMNQDIQEQYRRYLRRKMTVGFFLLAILAVSATCSLWVGPYDLGCAALLRSILGKGEEILQHVVWRIRLPRLAAGFLAGTCLGLAGAAMQTCLRNPLASPFTLGISQGAAFGAAFAIIILGAGNATIHGHGMFPLASPYLIVVCAFAGSLITVVAILILSAKRELSPAALILAGVALSSFFGAATMLLQYFASDIQVAASVFWTFGDLGKARWREIAMMALAVVPVWVYFMCKSWDFNAMLWGDDTAKSLGVNVNAMRLTSLVLAALISSVTTAFLGVIGFVGLIAPHILRMIIGDDHRFLFPYAALGGALLLIISDVLARSIMAPIVLPVGILTSFAGVPLFLYLLLKHKGVQSWD